MILLTGRRYPSPRAAGTDPATSPREIANLITLVPPDAERPPSAGTEAIASAAGPLLRHLAVVLDDAKAEDIVTIPLDDKTAIADTMVVASGRSNRHVGAIADQLVEKLKEAGHRDLKVEGMPQCDWVLVDAGDVVVHIFRPEVRSFYNIEKLWSANAPSERVAV